MNYCLFVCFVPFCGLTIIIIVFLSSYLLFNEVLDCISPVDVVLPTSTVMLFEIVHPLPDVISTETVP